MGKLKIVSLMQYGEGDEETLKLAVEQLLKEAEQKGYASNLEGDQLVWCYDIPLKADITIYLFANANVIYIDGKLAVKDIFSL